MYSFMNKDNDNDHYCDVNRGEDENENMFMNFQEEYN